MDLRRADWFWALVAALGFLAAAAFVVFDIRPGGFEGQIAWFFGLMPGAFVAALLSDRLYAIAPTIERTVFWGSLLGFTFLWYFAISYVLIKTYRLLARLWTRIHLC